MDRKRFWLVAATAVVIIAAGVLWSFTKLDTYPYNHNFRITDLYNTGCGGDDMSCPVTLGETMSIRWHLETTKKAWGKAEPLEAQVCLSGTYGTSKAECTPPFALQESSLQADYVTGPPGSPVALGTTMVSKTVSVDLMVGRAPSPGKGSGPMTVRAQATYTE